MRGPGPKRILSLDGGGIRGVLTLEYLEVIETLLRERSQNPNLLLCDYFDLIGGTSTGAILATTLACGFSVAQVKTLYTSLGASVFQRSMFRQGIFAAKFPAEPLEKALADALEAPTTLGDGKVRTGLMITAKRLDTGSPWAVHNHPDGPYTKENSALKLVSLVRASAAAPTYFEPEHIEIHSRAGVVTEGQFVDGGVSPHNNPCLQLLMLATLQGHGFGWKTGPNDLLIISIGTGTRRESANTEDPFGWVAAKQGVRALQSLMDDAAQLNLTLMQWLTRSLTHWWIDSEVQMMEADSQKGPSLATFARYNALLDAKWLASELGISYTDKDLNAISRMDDPSNMKQLAAIGAAAARHQVKTDHFAENFNLP